MNRKTENPKNQRIQVFARCRPLNSIEKKQCSPSVVDVIPDKKIVVKERNANREFLFDRVFPPDTKQISVYKAVVEPLIQEVLMGYNCTVFAYGQTGTGKTYTMEGERCNAKCSWEDDPGAGIIPRSLHQLFEDLNKEENVEFSVRVSFLELYNEELFDLLNSNELTRLRLYEDSAKKGSVIIQGLEEVIVNSKDEVYAILEKGTARRQTAATMLNATSSRSHTVFSVTVHIKENTIDGEELLKTGKLNLVDLAGSENVGRSGAVDKRAREAGNINQSLLTLGRVITALIEKQPHVPYRESKLTRLLQDSLGGHTKTSIIATISPALCNFDETISTLDYATKAKSITIKPEANQKMTKRALIKEYTEEIEKLRKDLVALRSKEGFYMNMDNYTDLMNAKKENEEKLNYLSDKMEALQEEKSKVEELFNETREKLTLTSQKLDETSQRYEETIMKLSNTTNALTFTKQVLSETALERDEKQLLLNVQRKTEKTLSQQAQKLLHVADETTSDVDKLHAKIDRKNTVEKTNEEKCKEFRMLYQKQFALLDDLVSHSEKQQSTNLCITKKNLDELVESLHNHHSQMANYLNELSSVIASGMKNISQSYTSGASSQINWTNTLLEDLKHKKQMLLKKQSVFLLEKIPQFVDEINMKNAEVEKWVSNTHHRICQQIEEQKQALCERSARRSKIQFSIKDSLDALCKSYDEILNEYKMQTSNIITTENKFDKDLEEQLTEFKKVLTSFEKLAAHKKELQKCSSTQVHYLVTNLESNALKLKAVKQPLAELSNLEMTLDVDKGALDEISSVLSVDEIATLQDSLKVSQSRIVNEFEDFTKGYAKEEEDMFSETENAIKCNLSSISQNVECMDNDVSDMKSSFEVYAQTGRTSVQEDVSKIQTAIVKTQDNIIQSEKALDSFTTEIKNEILKRDLEFEKFISEDLVKDVPTGTTPQRKNYTYPRLLAATSSPETILKNLAKHTALAINLPLNSSFNELDEDSPASTQEYIDSTEVHSVSFSSDESTGCETDSCASSVSDASIDSGRNKENKRKTKKSRLPKRLPNKVFAKPALPLTRKPLTVTNSAQEQTEI